MLRHTKLILSGRDRIDIVGLGRDQSGEFKFDGGGKGYVCQRRVS